MSYQRIRKELTDFATYYLMPLPALLLPWPLAYRWYDYLAGKSWLFDARVKAACINAGKLLQIDDMQQWKRQHRLTLMIDHIDFWISWLQPNRSRRLLETTGDWPQDKPFIVVGTHYGCGFMLMRALQRSAVDPYFIFRKTPAHVFQGQRLRQFYVYLRLRHQKKLFPGKCYHPGSYPRRLLRGLDQGNNILVLVDVPADQGRPAQNITLFGMKAAVDRGMFDLLIRRQLRYVTVQTQFDFKTAKRKLIISPAKQAESEQQFWEHMNNYINATLSTDSSQWHLWQVASMYLRNKHNSRGNES